jgi:hypothetical protein
MGREKMKIRWISALLVALFVLALSGSATRADNEVSSLRARLDGFQEIPSKLTNGHGTFSATISGNTISYTLTFSDLTTSALASHIHFGQRGVSGGIFAFLCGGGGKPACPSAGGTVTGTITAADILAPSPDQGLAAGDFAGALRAIRSGNTYVNVHTTRFPAGEIRGQLSFQGGEGD